jgi:hypothetical protein
VSRAVLLTLRRTTNPGQPFEDEEFVEAMRAQRENASGSVRRVAAHPSVAALALTLH